MKAGTTIIVLDKNDHGWWMGMSKSSPPKKGYLPKSYIRPKNIADQTDLEKTAEKRYTSALNYLNQEKYRRQFSMQTCEGFDSLVESGYAVEIKSVSTSTNASSNGNEIKENMRVELQVIAMIWDGSNTQTQVFSESNLKFTLGKNQVPTGIEEGVLKLKVEDEADIICAPLMAYGDAGQPPIIPPNVHIVYSVKVLSVTADPSECDKAAEGDPLLLSTGISQRVHGSSSNNAIGRKVSLPF